MKLIIDSTENDEDKPASLAYYALKPFIYQLLSQQGKDDSKYCQNAIPNFFRLSKISWLKFNSGKVVVCTAITSGFIFLT
jgi:hypothetical protein